MSKRQSRTMRVYRTTSWNLGIIGNIKSKKLVKTTSRVLKSMFAEIDLEIMEDRLKRLEAFNSKLLPASA